MICEFLTPQEEGKLPYAKTEYGKFIFIDKTCGNAKKVKAGDQWECEVFKNKEASTYIMVKPIKLLKTKDQVRAEFLSKVNQLENNGWKVMSKK